MIEAARVKALVFALVKAAGGGEAAAAVLGVSHQRVSQLTSMVNADMPTLMQVVALEGFVGQPIVTSALSKLCAGASKAADPVKEAAELVGATSRVLDACVEGGDPRKALQAVTAARKELDDVATALAEAVT